MTYVLGVDPPQGWALLGPDGKPLAYGSVRPLKRRTIARGIIECLEQCEDAAGSLVRVTLAIEGQYLPDYAGKGQRDRHLAVSTMQTIRSAGKWIGICEAEGLTIYDQKGIQATVWRSAVWGRGVWRTDQAKRHAVVLAKQCWGVDIKPSNHHEAEALWIAEYARVDLRTKE